MKKLIIALTVLFSIATVNIFAADKTDKEKKAEKKKEMMMKLAPGKSCTKKCAEDKAKDEKTAEVKKP